MIVHAKRVYTSKGCLNAYLEINEGKITNIYEEYQRQVDLELDNLIIIPGIIDTHNHGGNGYSLMGEVEDKAANIRGFLKGLGASGVTAVLPTADTGYFKDIVKVSKEKIRGAQIVGIHSEGPYLNRVGEKGVKTNAPTINLENIETWIKDAEGLLKVMGIAPELEGAKEAINLLTSHNIKVAFAHSDCDMRQALQAFEEGISITTHTGNVMSGLHHREMGGLGACLLNDDVYNELICDGLHICNEMIEIMFRVKKDAYNHFLMVSDNVALANAPCGEYLLPMEEGPLKIIINEEGYCLTETGRLMGSTLPVIKGVKNLVLNIHIPLEDVLKMCSLNPARFYDLKNKGELKVGNDADFVVINDDFDVLYTYALGQEIYNHEIDKELFNKQLLNCRQNTNNGSK